MPAKKPKRFVISVTEEIHQRLIKTAKVERRKLQDVVEMLIVEAISVRIGRAK